jgi:hypothetical protein
MEAPAQILNPTGRHLRLAARAHTSPTEGACLRSAPRPTRARSQRLRTDRPVRPELPRVAAFPPGDQHARETRELSAGNCSGAAWLTGQHAIRAEPAKPGHKVPCGGPGPGVELSSRPPARGIGTTRKRRSTRRGNPSRRQGDEAAGTGDEESPIGSVTGTDHRRALATHTLKGPSPMHRPGMS